MFTLEPPQNRLIGHRGISALAPENTRVGFNMAAQHHFQWVEFDIRLTKDNQIVVFHDDTLDRTTNGKGEIEKFNLSELVNLDAGGWFHPLFMGEKIPVFSEILPFLLELGLILNIELKFSDSPTAQHVQKLTQQLAFYIEKTQAFNRILISSFHWPALFATRALLPTVPLGFLVEQCDHKIIDEIAKTPNAALHCHYPSVTSDLLMAAQQLKIPILAYTVNDTAIASDLIGQGIFALFSDNPPMLR